MRRRNELLPLAEQTFELHRKILGPEHLSTLYSSGNLAQAYWSNRQYAKAIELFEQCLERTRKIRGHEHPETITVMHNLACSYDSAGQFAKAIELHEGALDLRRKILGPEHPATITSMKNLATAYRSAGLFDKELPLREQVLELRARCTVRNTPTRSKRWTALAGFIFLKRIALQHQTLPQPTESGLRPNPWLLQYSLGRRLCYLRLRSTTSPRGADDQELSWRQRQVTASRASSD